MIEVIMKLPRTEKYSIGTEYKTAMYKMLENLLLLSKVREEEKINYINYVDAELNVQRILSNSIKFTMEKYNHKTHFFRIKFKKVSFIYERKNIKNNIYFCVVYNSFTGSCIC